MTCRWTCARGVTAGEETMTPREVVPEERADDVHGWWDALEADILETLRRHGPLSPSQLAGFLGFSEATATSLITMLAAERRVRIARVDLAGSGETLEPDRLRVAA